MRITWIVRLALASASLGACGGDDGASGDDAPPDAPTGAVENYARGIVDTQLAFDVTGMSGTATIRFAASDAPGATLEVGDLVIDSVTYEGAELVHARRTTTETTRSVIDLALPASAEEVEVSFAFHYVYKASLNGVSMRGFSFSWPYFCGNIFPCHSVPDDGTTMSLALTGVAAGKTAVYPATLSEAPSYQLAWSVDEYTELSLGTTDAGTQIAAWHLANRETITRTATEHLVAAVDWMEKTLGPYRFGPKMGSVETRWSGGAIGGMEHHPYWHIAVGSWGDAETHVHEAAHGWYGDGIRIKCWEDFVLSEGTTTYLAARSLDVVAPAVGAMLWQGYASQLASFAGTELVLPEGCGEIDILDDGLFTNAPYIRGAYFYRAVADKVGATTLDAVLGAFYAEHQGKSAHMSDMLALIKSQTGYDPAACADIWFHQPTVPTPAACP